MSDHEPTTPERLLGVDLDHALDPSTPVGRFAATILEAVDELVRDLTAERTRDALASKRSRGERVGRERELPDATLARVVELRESGLSLREIARTLEAEGIPTATGRTRWYASTVSTALAAWEYERELAANRTAHVHRLRGLRSVDDGDAAS